MIVNNRLLYAVIFYILVITLVYLSRTPLIFDAEGRLKQFGVGKNKTPYSFGILVGTGAIISFYIMLLIDCFL